jgi:4-hydroxyphenylpyruvate dioxygenase
MVESTYQRTSRRKEKITKEFRLYGGPGIQHIAATDDILKPKLNSARGVSFISSHILTIKQFQNVWERIHENDEEINEIEKLAIMVDADEDGIYCKYSLPVQDRPTFF